MTDYYRKTVNNTANDVKLKMQMAAFTLKLSENNDKIDDLLEVDKDIKKDIIDNSNSIKNMKNEIDLKLSDKVDNLLSDNYYDKTEIKDKNSKLNRNIVLFNTNLTNHIDKYSNEKKDIDEDIKENKDNLNISLFRFTRNILPYASINT